MTKAQIYLDTTGILIKNEHKIDKHGKITSQWNDKVWDRTEIQIKATYY